MVTISRTASVTDFESPAIPFCAASAMTTMTSKSAIPTEPACRRKIRSSTNITRYIMLPRMKISKSDSFVLKTESQSTLRIFSDQSTLRNIFKRTFIFNPSQRNKKRNAALFSLNRNSSEYSTPRVNGAEIKRRRVQFLFSYNWLVNNLFCTLSSIALVKAVNASGSVNQFLFPGKKRVTFRADFDMQIIFHCRAGLKSIAARADNRYFVVVWMYFRFHFFNGLLLFN